MIRLEGQISVDYAPFDFEIATSSIHVLPDEILAEIFCLCLCPGEDPIAPEWWSNLNTMSSRQFPWILMRVCSRWADVAVETPVLWSYISFRANFMEFMPRVQLKLKRMLTTLRIMLQRSGNTPLHIQLVIDYLPIDAKECFPQWSKIIEQIFLHSQRWKAICFPCCDDVLESLESIDAPKLLEVAELSTNRVKDYNKRFSILQGCQNLRHLTLNHLTARYIAVPREPWTNIVSHDCVGQLDKHQLQLLQRMPRLAQLQVRRPSVLGPMQPATETIICKELKLLYLPSGEPETQNLILPSLETIVSGETQRCSDSIVPMLIQSGYPLKQLTISTRFRLAPADICALLEAAPSLLSLTLFDCSEYGWTIPLIARLAVAEPTSQRVCTQLRYLFVQPHTRDFRIFIEALSEVLEVRRTAHSSSTEAGFAAIERVNVQLDKHPGDNFMALAHSVLDSGVVKIQMSGAGWVKELM